jgi:hypothetical protein
VNSVITITGIGDQLRPEWPITFTGIRRRTANPWRAALKGIYRAVDAAAGEAALRAFEEGFLGPEIPTISQSWRRAWGEVVRSMPFPQPRGRDESALPGREIAVLSLCYVADIQSRTTVYRPAAKQGVGVCITSIDGNARDLRQAPTAFRRVDATPSARPRSLQLFSKLRIFLAWYVDSSQATAGSVSSALLGCRVSCTAPGVARLVIFQ